MEMIKLPAAHRTPSSLLPCELIGRPTTSTPRTVSPPAKGGQGGVAAAQQRADRLSFSSLSIARQL